MTLDNCTISAPLVVVWLDQTPEQNKLILMNGSQIKSDAKSINQNQNEKNLKNMNNPCFAGCDANNVGYGYAFSQTFILTEIYPTKLKDYEGAAGYSDFYKEKPS